jgi:hypothetical protein
MKAEEAKIGISNANNYNFNRFFVLPLSGDVMLTPIF